MLAAGASLTHALPQVTPVLVSLSDLDAWNFRLIFRVFRMDRALRSLQSSTNPIRSHFRFLEQCPCSPSSGDSLRGLELAHHLAGLPSLLRLGGIVRRLLDIVLCEFCPTAVDDQPFELAEGPQRCEIIAK